jgi:hypothetical protein
MDFAEANLQCYKGSNSLLAIFMCGVGVKADRSAMSPPSRYALPTLQVEEQAYSLSQLFSNELRLTALTKAQSTTL